MTLFDDGFDRFWAAYPRRVKRDYAEKCWRKLAPDEALQAVILASVEAHRAEWTSRRFTPHASTFLNQRQWTDEIDREPRPNRPPTDADAFGWCDHSPRCGTFAGHDLKLAREARERGTNG